MIVVPPRDVFSILGSARRKGQAAARGTHAPIGNPENNHDTTRTEHC